MLKIDTLFAGSVRLKDIEWVKEKITNYVATNQTPTFRGLLAYMDVTSKDLKEFMVDVDNGDKKALVTFRILERFKRRIEAKIEEWLTYQSIHPDIQDKYVNYKALQWILERNNPAEFKLTSERKAKEEVKELKNESGFSLKYVENS